MYIIENRVFFTCGKMEEFDEQILLNNLEKFGNIELKTGSNWFNRFNISETDYLKFIIKKQDNEDWFNFNVDSDFKTKYTIEKFIVKVHKNGISSTEVFFKLKNNSSEKFDEDLDVFSNQNSDKLFEVVFTLNELLAELGII